VVQIVFVAIPKAAGMRNLRELYIQHLL
jgi:hypothetical protein